MLLRSGLHDDGSEPVEQISELGSDCCSMLAGYTRAAEQVAGDAEQKVVYVVVVVIC